MMSLLDAARLFTLNILKRDHNEMETNSLCVFNNGAYWHPSVWDRKEFLNISKILEVLFQSD